MARAVGRGLLETPGFGESSIPPEQLREALAAGTANAESESRGAECLGGDGPQPGDAAESVEQDGDAEADAGNFRFTAAGTVGPHIELWRTLDEREELRGTILQAIVSRDVACWSYQQPYPVPRRVDFVGMASGRPDYLPGSDIAEVAEVLLEQYPEFLGLRSVRIGYLWRREGAKRSGQLIGGAAQRTTALSRYFSAFDVVIYLAADVLEKVSITARELEAAVYHELCHVGRTVRGRVTWHPHDFSGFAGELARYGPWTAPLQEMQQALEPRPVQMEMDFGAAGVQGDEAAAVV